MPNPFKTREFRSLFQTWNRILEQNGHQEIEDFSREEPLLRSWHDHRWQTDRNNTRNDARQQYYEMAEVLLKTYRFRNDDHRRVWELYCQGLSPRKIERIMNRRKLSKSNIYNIISEIEKASGLKNG